MFRAFAAAAVSTILIMGGDHRRIFRPRTRRKFGQ